MKKKQQQKNLLFKFCNTGKHVLQLFLFLIFHFHPLACDHL